MKLVRSKDSDLPQIEKQLKKLSENYVRVGHFESQGKHSDSDLTYPALLYIWYMGLAHNNEGIKRQPREAFIWKQFENAGILSDMTLKNMVEDYVLSMATGGSDDNLMEKVGKHMKKKYQDVFGQVGHLMPTDRSGTPMLETHELAMNTAYLTKSNQAVRK